MILHVLPFGSSVNTFLSPRLVVLEINRPNHGIFYLFILPGYPLCLLVMINRKLSGIKRLMEDCIGEEQRMHLLLNI